MHLFKITALQLFFIVTGNLFFYSSINAAPLNIAPGTMLNIIASQTLVADGISSNAGEIYNEGLFNASGIFSNTSNIYNSNQILNSGSLTNDGGVYSYSLTSSFINSASGILTNNTFIEAANISNVGVWYNYGSLAWDTFSNSGNFHDYSNMYINEEQTLNNAGTFEVHYGFTNYGTFNGQAGSTLVLHNSINNYGQFTSGGSFENNVQIYNEGNFTNSGNMINNSNIYGSGYPESSFTNATSGTLTNNGGVSATHVSNAGTWHNYGYIELYDSFSNTGHFYADSQMWIDYGKTINNTGTFEINSDFYNDGSFINTGITTNNANFHQQQGVLLIAENSIFNGTGNFFQEGGNSIVNGTLEQDNIIINGGSLQGNGDIIATNGSIQLNGVAINPGNSVGSLNFDGDTYFNGPLNIEVESDTSFDTVFFDTISFGELTTFTFVFDSAFTPFDSQLIEFLFADAISGFENIAFFVTGLTGDTAYDLINNGSSIALEFTSSVPVPPAILLFGSGMVLLVLGKRCATNC